MSGSLVLIGVIGLLVGIVMSIRLLIKKKKKTFPSVVILASLALIIISTFIPESIPDYEIVEEDNSRESVLMVRAVTESEDEEDLIKIAEHIKDEIRDTGTFEGLNTFAAYIRIHEPSNDGDFGGLILDSRVAYRDEGLPITGLDETDKLYIESQD